MTGHMAVPEARPSSRRPAPPSPRRSSPRTTALGMILCQVLTAAALPSGGVLPSEMGTILLHPGRRAPAGPSCAASAPLLHRSAEGTGDRMGGMREGGKGPASGIAGGPQRQACVLRGGMDDGGETASTLTDPAMTTVKDFMALERQGSQLDEGQGWGGVASRHQKARVLGFTRVQLGGRYAWFYPDPPWGRKDIHRAGSKFLQYWDILVWFTMAYISLVIPFDIAGFRSTRQDDCTSFAMTPASVLADWIFFFDMIFSSRTAYYKRVTPGELVLVDDVPSVQRAYVNSIGFVCDALGILPMQEILCMSERLLAYVRQREAESRAPGIVPRKFIKASRLLRLAKLLRLHHFRHMWRFVNQRFPSKGRALGVIKLLVMLLFTGHILACAWYFVGSLSADSWIGRNRDLFEPPHGWLSRYVACFYFVYATMTTVGYGDYKGVTVQERIFCVVAMVVGGFLFGVLIGSVPRVMERRSAAGNRYSELEGHVKEYLSEKNTPVGLQGRVLHYLEHRYPDRRMFEEESILRMLPKGVRRDLDVVLHQDLINVCLILSRAATQAVRDVCGQLQEQFAEKDTVVVREGTPPRGVFFVRSGQVELTRCGGVVKRLLPGEVFGENALLGPCAQDESLYTATALAPTVLCHLPLEAFEGVVAKHPNMAFTTNATQWNAAREHIVQRLERRTQGAWIDDALKAAAGVRQRLQDLVMVQQQQTEVLRAWGIPVDDHTPMQSPPPASDSVTPFATSRANSEVTGASPGPTYEPQSPTEAAAVAFEAAIQPTVSPPKDNGVPKTPQKAAEDAAKEFEMMRKDSPKNGVHDGAPGGAPDRAHTK